MRDTEHNWPSFVNPALRDRRLSAHGAVAGRLPTSRWMSAAPVLVFVLVGVWVAMAVLVNPLGEFPLNDDWSYSRAVQSLVERHRLEFTGFTSMPLITQVLWGALFCLPSGFSFTALRISTMFLGGLGVVATYRLLDELKIDHRIALLGTAVVAMNPLYFVLSFTFMTDVPFFTCSMLSLFFLSRALDMGNRGELIAGYGFAGAAILIRQLGVIIPLSFVVAYLVKYGFGPKTLRNAFAPAGMLIALLIAYQVIVQQTIGLPALYGRSFEPILESASVDVMQVPLIFATRLLNMWVLLGLLLLPLLIPLTADAWRGLSPRSKLTFASCGVVLFASMMGALLWQGRTKPLLGNVLFDLGLGPALLRDIYLLGLPHWPTATKEFWLAMTSVAVTGSILLVLHVLASCACVIKPPDSWWKVKRPQTLFFLTVCLTYAALIAVTGFMDRYLIFLLPPLMFVMFSAKDSVPAHERILPLPFSVAGMLVVLYGLFALGGTHDYLVWNRARWQALDDLLRRQISYKNIDGGFEFNGWYAYDAQYREHLPQSWWWVDRDDYVISFGPINGYSEVSRYPFDRWIPPGQAHILVLRRVAEAVNAEK